MNHLNNSRSQVRWTALVAALAMTTASSAEGEKKEMYKPVGAAVGGLDPRPTIHMLTEEDGTVTIGWQGLTPPYQVEGSPNATDPVWQAIGGFQAGTSAALNVTTPMEVFRVRAADPIYVGAKECGRCHRDAHDDWSQTGHAHALQTLTNIGMDHNARCLGCHTVGLGLPSGFVSPEQTPQLGGVQCENCHGPGGNHAFNPFDETMRPKVTLAAEACGGCHTDAHHPTYDEWTDSRHAHVDDHVAEYFVHYGESRMNSCGACHSGAVRMAMLEHWEELQEDPNAEMEYPTGEDAAYFSVECAVCHNAHKATAHAQLRNPRASLVDFSYSTSKPFAEQYDPEVQLCGQCHNMRGATWDSSSRPPHHSPQYNVLIGLGGVNPGGEQMLSTHSRLEHQCARCHTHGHESEHPTEETPNYTGHTFEPTFVGCVECHYTEELAELLAEGTQQVIKDRIAIVKGLLDEWAATKAPEELRAKYGALAWEYSNVGQISNPDGTVGPGPTSAEQALIPDGIRQARFNLYLIEHDGSHGVHNGGYARHLLNVARSLVKAELEAN